MKYIIIILLLITATSVTYAQKYAYHPQYITVLSVNKGKDCLTQCSRSVPDSISGFYKVTSADSLVLIQNLKKILSTKLMGSSRTLKTLKGTCFQLLGVMIGDKKFIYINAFDLNEDDLKFDDYKKWKTEPIRVCDGGITVWGALFDPSERSFSQLSFNGVG